MVSVMTQANEAQGPNMEGPAEEGMSGNTPPKEKRVVTRPYWWDDFETS
jgi:hypothetical protein